MQAGEKKGNTSKREKEGNFLPAKKGKKVFFPFFPRIFLGTQKRVKVKAFYIFPGPFFCHGKITVFLRKLRQFFSSALALFSREKRFAGSLFFLFLPNCPLQFPTKRLIVGFILFKKSSITCRILKIFHSFLLERKHFDLLPVCFCFPFIPGPGEKDREARMGWSGGSLLRPSLLT